MTLARRCCSLPRLTLLGRSGLLVLAELAANLLLWIVAVALFAPDPSRRGVLSLVLVAWTLGLRHGLDMDHIVAIDNVTRNLVAMGQLPITCGLFFSLGHSSIVVGVTIAIIISTSSIQRIPGVASVGGVIGVSVSASFLVILAIINSVVLHLALQRRRKERTTLAAAEGAEVTAELPEAGVESKKPKRDIVPGLPATSCIARLAKPLFKAIDRPWKMYPVGVLFGFGFDTSSEIALLGVSALARSGSSSIPTSSIILLPLLFTAGMSLVDSLDSVFMLHAYALPPVRSPGEQWRKSLRVFESREEPVEERDDKDEVEVPEIKMMDPAKLLSVQIVLTIISISIALLIAIIEFMGLAAEKCVSCAEAAQSDPAGRWWRFWGDVNDNSGYLGAGVVGVFIVVLGGWGIANSLQKRRRRRTQEAAAATSGALPVASL